MVPHDVVGVEVAGVVGNTTDWPVVMAVMTRPLRGAVHQRRQHHELGAGALGDALGDLVVGTR